MINLMDLTTKQAECLPLRLCNHRWPGTPGNSSVLSANSLGRGAFLRRSDPSPLRVPAPHGRSQYGTRMKSGTIHLHTDV